MIQIMKGEEVYKEFDVPESEEQAMLKRAKLRAEILTRDKGEEFTARVKPVEVVEAKEV